MNATLQTGQYILPVTTFSFVLSEDLTTFHRLCMWLSTDMSYTEFCEYEYKILGRAIDDFRKRHPGI
jgi:hypothetical protein